MSLYTTGGSVRLLFVLQICLQLTLEEEGKREKKKKEIDISSNAGLSLQTGRVETFSMSGYFLLFSRSLLAFGLISSLDFILFCRFCNNCRLELVFFVLVALLVRYFSLYCFSFLFLYN